MNMTGHSRTYDMVSIADTERAAPKPLVDVRSQPQVLPSEKEATDSWSDAEIGRFYRLVKSGWDLELIAQTMDIPEREVSQKKVVMIGVLTGARLKREQEYPKQTREITTEDWMKVAELAAEGKTVLQIATATGLSYYQTRKLFRRHGRKGRPQKVTA